jgi:hypothetical protein
MARVEFGAAFLDFSENWRGSPRCRAKALRSEALNATHWRIT